MKFDLKKPIHFEGKEVKSLDLNLDDLTAADLIKVEQEILASGKQFVFAESSKVYSAHVAARAAKVPVEIILALKGPDFSKLTMTVQNFLIA